jgi:zinc protease
MASAKAAAVKYLTKDSAVVLYCVPGKKVLNDVPRSPDDTDANVKITNPYTPEFEASQAWRREVPKAGPPATVHLPVPETFTLANGMKVYVVPEHSLPVLSASFVTRAGSENNTAGKEGLASLTAQTMGEATKTRDLKSLADAQERIGVSVRIGASMDGASAGLTVLTNHTGEALDLFADVLQHPAFNDADLDRLRKQRLVGIQQETDSVGSMVNRVGPKLLYGEQPYGLSQTGTTESVTGLTHDDVTGFYENHYGPADSALVLVGDVTTAEAKKLAELYFGGWTGKASAAIMLPAAPTLEATHVVIVDKPGAPQTALDVFGVGVPANFPDLQTLQVMNYVLGSSFASRINMNLREMHGYTYGANSNYQSYRAGGPFVAGGLVRTDVTGPAAKELMGEIRKFPSNPPTETELNEAKVARIQSLPGLFETSFAIAGSITSIFLYDRPLDYYATLPAKYEAVTLADVARVATEDVHPDQLIIVAAGDRAKIEPQLKDAGLGPVEVRTIDGKLEADQQ